MAQGEEVPLSERRGTVGERRRYNRRTSPEPGSPPYYEVFDRIASALESIASAMSSSQATGSPSPSAPPTAVRPRRAGDDEGPTAS